MRLATCRPSVTCIGSRWSSGSKPTALVGAAIVAAAAIAFPPPVGGGGFPVLGTGDIHFRLDHASFRSGAGTTECEFYIEIDNNELAFRPEGDRYQARVGLRLEFYGSRRKLVEKAYTPDFWEQDEA